MVVLLVDTIRQRSGRGLVDDPTHVQTSNFASVLGRCALGIVEVGWNGDDRIRDLLTQGRLRSGFQTFEGPWR